MGDLTTISPREALTVARILRVNHAELAVPLGAGTHRVSLRYRPRGVVAGTWLAAAAAALLALGGRFS